MFDSIFNYFSDNVLASASELVITFADIISPLMGACVILYSMYVVFQLFNNPQFVEPFETVKFLLSLAICAGLAFNTGFIVGTLAPIIYNMGDNISSLLLGGDGASGTLQEMFNSFYKVIYLLTMMYLSDVDLFTIFTYIIVLTQITSIILWYTVFFIIALIYLLMAKVVLGLLLVFSPLFIMFAFFPTTRGMFKAWTGQCFNYILLTMAYPIVFSFMNDALFNGYSSLISNFTVINTFKTVLILAVCCFVSLQIPSICSALAGGFGISGVFSTMGQGARAGINAGKMLATGGGWAGKAAGAVASKFKNTIKPG